jgi:hypothetical protein
MPENSTLLRASLGTQLRAALTDEQIQTLLDALRKHLANRQHPMPVVCQAARLPK